MHPSSATSVLILSCMLGISFFRGRRGGKLVSGLLIRGFSINTTVMYEINWGT